MAMSDFTPNRLGYMGAACTEEIRKICAEEMERTSDILVEIIQKQIDYLGNGTKAMKWAAKQAIKKILVDLYNPVMTIGVGVDEDYAQSVSFQFYVRALVVIYGNQHDGPLKTKPGKNTFKKEVFDYGPSKAQKEYNLPDGFNQESVAQYIQENTLKEIQKYFTDMMDNIDRRCSEAFFGQFLEG